MLNTSNPNNYEYTTKHLEVHILGGIKTTKLETLRITLSVQKPKQHNVLRHSIDLYNDNQVEKLVRKIAERLEIGTSIARRTIQDLTKELENYYFILLEQQVAPASKELTQTELRAAEAFLKKKNLLQITN
jgi:G:T/U-mismatch repair DNA glycosylase